MAIASVYAVSIGGERTPDDTDWTDDVKRKLVDKIPVLVEEIQRLEAIVEDPFVKACIQMRDALRSQLGKEPNP